MTSEPSPLDHDEWPADPDASFLGKFAAAHDDELPDVFSMETVRALYDQKRATALIESQAWEYNHWPEWLRSIVDRTAEVADRLDMSSEQAHAFAALLATSRLVPAQPAGGEVVAWPEPKVVNPDIAQPTGQPYIDCLIHRVLDAQQDINLAANERMDQSLCDASALCDEIETVLRRVPALYNHPSPSLDAVREAGTIGGSTTAYSREQLAKLAFVVFYSPVLCAPQNISAVVKEIDCCPGCEHLSGGGMCPVSERGDYCPNDLAETLRQISLALYGPRDPSHYVPAVFSPDNLSALASAQIADPVDFQWKTVSGWNSANIAGTAEQRREYAYAMALLCGLGYRELYASALPAGGEVVELHKRLLAAHNAFAELDGVSNDHLVAVLDARDALASSSGAAACPACDGTGQDLEIINPVTLGPTDCRVCNGRGKQPPANLPTMEEVAAVLEPFASFAEKAGRFVQGRADFGGDPVMPTKHFRLADFRRARALLDRIKGGA